MDYIYVNIHEIPRKYCKFIFYFLTTYAKIYDLLINKQISHSVMKTFLKKNTCNVADLGSKIST